MFNTISKIIRLKLLNIYRDFFKQYVRDKYNITGDICFVYSHNNEDLFYMTDTTQGICKPSADSCRYIRQVCGANKLNEYGIPLPEQITPQLVLVPTFSMIKVLGIKRFFKFCKDWKGDSSVGDIVVLKYSVMK